MTDKKLDIKDKLPKATEVVFSFDTTGSMAPCIKNVRKHIEKTCEQLFEDIPGLKIGFIAHGDYCDAIPYTLLPLTDDKAKIFKFIRSVPNTGGGDAPECYELALNLARSMGWSDAKGGKILVLIGDDEPHDPNYTLNKDRLDWKKEAATLKEAGIDVYPLQCLYTSFKTGTNEFWSLLAETAGTTLMKLENFEEASANLAGYVAASAGGASFDTYEKKLLSKGVKLTKSTNDNLDNLRKISAKYDSIEEIEG
jgi:Mg-chelatase subunit ChlD